MQHFCVGTLYFESENSSFRAEFMEPSFLLENSPTDFQSY